MQHTSLPGFVNIKASMSLCLRIYIICIKYLGRHLPGSVNTAFPSATRVTTDKLSAPGSTSLSKQLCSQSTHRRHHHRHHHHRHHHHSAITSERRVRLWVINSPLNRLLTLIQSKVVISVKSHMDDCHVDMSWECRTTSLSCHSSDGYIMQSGRSAQRSG